MLNIISLAWILFFNKMINYSMFMKFNYVTLFLIIYTVGTRGLKAQDVDYISNYHKIIYKSEQAIIKEDYNTALVYYDSAFNNVPYSFYNDYKNAAYIAYMANNNNKARQYLDSAVIRGVSFKKQFKRYFDDKSKWKRWKNTNYDSLVLVGTSRYDFKKIKIADSLGYIDQLYRTGGLKRNTDSVLLYDDRNAKFIEQYLINNSLGEQELGAKKSGNIGLILLHISNEYSPMIYYMYINGLIEKRIYYYAIVRKSLQFSQDSKYMSRRGLVVSKREQDSFDLKRKNDGIITIVELKKLKSFANKSHSLFYTLTL